LSTPQHSKKINKTTLPSDSLLKSYAAQEAYTDCYSTDLFGNFTFENYVEAFYTTRLFKLERFILKWLVSKPSSDQQARQLSEGLIDHFAAWTVEERADKQILMCDFQNRTRSWLMLESVRKENEIYTQLYFGSAVVRNVNGTNRLGVFFNLLLGFHNLYSKALLKAARKRLLVERQ